MKVKFLILLLLIVPTYAFANTTINTSFDNEKCILTVNGIQSGHDATVSIFNEDNELIGFKTGEIINNNYSIDFVLTFDNDQKINITISNESGTNDYSKNNIDISACARNDEGNNKKYVVSDELGNSISFTKEDGHTYSLTIFDFIGLTDQELEALEISKEEYNSALQKIIAVTKENGTLISFFEIELKDENSNHITDGPLKIKIKITDEMKKYDIFKLIYVDTDNNFATEDPIDLEVNGDYLEGTLNHLSTYALVGTKSSTQYDIQTNPKTGDNIIFYVSMLGLSALGLVGAGLYVKKKKNN